jgi:hypothetical protein
MKKEKEKENEGRTNGRRLTKAEPCFMCCVGKVELLKGPMYQVVRRFDINTQQCFKWS